MNKSNSCDYKTDGYNCCNAKISYNTDPFECAKTNYISEISVCCIYTFDVNWIDHEVLTFASLN